jgi:undecaprenyl pyrophosphate phosphatase UppP
MITMSFSINKTKEYVKTNWGSPFIIGFIVLLVTTVVSLSIGLQYMADTIAIYAYYALILGVVLQLASFIKNRNKDGEGV